MSTASAQEYAESVAKGIQEMSDAGSPFGWINQQTGEWVDEEPAGWNTEIDTDWHEATALDYLQDVLSIEYRVTGEREYRSAEILIAFGGPNAWIDTKTSTLRVAWWSAPVEITLSAAFIQGLDEALEELWSDH